MRIVILADIHGNQVALEAALQDIAQQADIDQIVVAGDLCLNGPRPCQVLDILQELHCPVIQGNVDTDVVALAPKGPRKRAIVEWTREQIGPEGMQYLANLPREYLVSNPEGKDLLVVHANPLDQEQAIFPTAPESMLAHLLSGLPTTVGVLAFGHLHVTYTRHWQHLFLVDVGSCGLPRDHDQRAAYAILTYQDGVWQAEHHRVPYDIKETVQQLRDCGMPYAERRIKVLTAASYT